MATALRDTIEDEPGCQVRFLQKGDWRPRQIVFKTHAEMERFIKDNGHEITIVSTMTTFLAGVQSGRHIIWV